MKCGHGPLMTRAKKTEFSLQEQSGEHGCVSNGKYIGRICCDFAGRSADFIILENVE